MTFYRLAEYFERLETTSSRLILMDILSELFVEVKIDEIEKVIYLISGRVAPFYEAVEIGMAEKTVAAAIAKAYGVDREKVLKDYGQMGDLGLVAEKLANDGSRRFGFSRASSLVTTSLRSTREISPARHPSSRNSSLSVSEVFEILTEIAKTSGVGTVEKKQDLLISLIRQMSPIESRHLVRIPMGVNRLGIGDPTLLEALAKGLGGGRQNKKILEGAYNKTSDLGLIAKTLLKSGLKGVEKLEVTVGRPIRSQLAERLPDAKTILEKEGGRVHVQYKYDGFRVQIHLDRTGASLRGAKGDEAISKRDRHAGARDDGAVVRLFSRNLEETTLMMPDIIAGVLKQVKAKTAIFDSEALAYNPISEEFLPFQETTKRRRKYQIEETAKALPLKAFVFDIMYLNGKSLVDEPLESRIKSLESSIKGDDILIPEPGEMTEKQERIEELFNDSLTKGLEGLICKRPDSRYEAGARNFNWVKLKRHSAGELKDTIDCVILGYIYGRGKRADFGAGALLVGVYDETKDEFVTICKIGTGLTDVEWREIHRRADKIKVDHKPARVNSEITPSVWVEPKIVIEVLADEITKSPLHTAGASTSSASGEKIPGLALRFPRLVRFREDKLPEDSTTVKELKEMYKLQYQKN